jgi:ubiquinone/menaquinone biosynthesis C-methylase UbiE
MSEIERIKGAYERRKTEGKGELYSYFNQGNLFIIHQRETALIHSLKQLRLTDLSDRKILDVGCGSGGFLREFVKYGAKPQNLYGIDLLEERIEKARELNPNIHFRCGDASNLPYEDHFFDMVMQFTVFTSILDSGMKQKIASEMLRVLKADGTIIWYDYYVNNPWNPDVKGVNKKEIQELFPNRVLSLKRVTLAPPIARTLIPASTLLCLMLEKIPFLRTHYLGMIRRKQP